MVVRPATLVLSLTSSRRFLGFCTSWRHSFCCRLTLASGGRGRLLPYLALKTESGCNIASNALGYNCVQQRQQAKKYNVKKHNNYNTRKGKGGDLGRCLVCSPAAHRGPHSVRTGSACRMDLCLAPRERQLCLLLLAFHLPL
jgi:hypothetical protein